MLGVAIRRPNQDDYTFEPATMEQQMMTAIRSLDMPVAFSMASDITSTVFTLISTYQTELVIQSRGIGIPVVDSLQSIPARSFEIRQRLACLVKQENIVLLLANTVESALLHGSNVEHMLMESVRHGWTYGEEAFANAGQVWGSSFGTPRALSRPVSHFIGSQKMRPSSLARSGTGTATSMYFSRPQSMLISDSVGNKEDDIPIETMKIDDGKEEIADPEEAGKGHAKRPMILTHSVMVGLTLIILITIESLVISRVRTQQPLRRETSGANSVLIGYH